MKPYGTETMKKLLTLFVLLFAFVLVGATFLDSEAFSGNKTVNITGIFEGSETFTDSDVYPYGSKVSMDLAGAPEGQTFAFWIVNGIVQPELAVNYQFTIVNNMNLQVVFTPVDKVVAVFVDVNGGYLGSRYVTSGGSADTSLIALPERPGFDAVDGAGRWTSVHGSAAVTAITQNSVFVQNYTDDATVRTVDIAVTNGTGGGTKNFNSIVTLVADAAPGGQKFSHWVENGVKISNLSTYKFTALYNRDITAVYVAEATVLQDEVIVTLSNDLERRPGYHTYVGQVEVPAGYTVVEYGFFIGNEAVILSESQNSNVVQGTNIHPITNEFVASISIGSHLSVRAYVVVNDGEAQTIVKSEVNHRYIGGEYEESFESLSNWTSYPTSDTLKTFDTKSWTIKEVLLNPDASDLDTATSMQGSKMLRFKGANTAYAYTNDYFQYVDTISFDAKYYNLSNNTAQMSVWKKYSGGEWTLIENISLTLSYTNYVVQVNDYDVSIKIQVLTKSANIDNIAIDALYKDVVHDVTFEENNGNTVNQLAIDGQEISSYTPIKTGYIFSGWYTNDSFTGDTYNFSSSVTNELVLYAKWTINQYSISFNTNGGSAVTAIIQDYNTSVSAPTSPTREGYAFDGWYSDAGLTSPYAFSTMPAQNITLYARWTINQYTIDFNVDGGSSISPITQDYGTSVSAPSNPTKTNFNFAGWFTEASFENEYTFSTIPAQNITLYAKWVDATSTATVTFNSNGGSAVSAAIVNIGDPVAEPSDPTKTGYSFVKWEITSGVEWNFANVINEDITLTAVWVINQYTISFNSNGGSSVTAITQDYNTAVVAPSDPTNDGYTFGGWYSDSGLNTAYTFSTMPSQNITLYAKWNVILSDYSDYITLSTLGLSSSTISSYVTLSNVDVGNGLVSGRVARSSAQVSTAGGTVNKIQTNSSVTPFISYSAQSGYYIYSVTLLDVNAGTNRTIKIDSITIANVTTSAADFSPYIMPTQVTSFTLTPSGAVYIGTIIVECKPLNP